MKTLPFFGCTARGIMVFGHLVWPLTCLDFNRAVQAKSLQRAKLKLQPMVKSYLAALAEDGPDHELSDSFLRRKAPLEFWVKYYWYSYWCLLIAKIFGLGDRCQS